jgi:CRP-like cAMP-binding protein
MTSRDLSGLLLIEKVLLLKSLSIFSETPETILAEMAHLLQEVEYAEGSSIVKEGETGNCMYIIFRGEIKITKERELLATLKEKDVFGELSLMDTETRSATATALTDCVLFRMDQEPFYDLMESRPEVVKGILKILCKRIRMANQRILELTKPGGN